MATLAISSFISAFVSREKKEAAARQELAAIRARKRSYISQLDALEWHFSPTDAAAVHTRERLLDLVAECVRRELDLMDDLGI